MSKKKNKQKDNSVLEVAREFVDLGADEAEVVPLIPAQDVYGEQNVTWTCPWCCKENKDGYDDDVASCSECGLTVHVLLDY